MFKRTTKVLGFIGTTALTFSLMSPAIAAEKQVIAGAGPSTKVVQLFVERFGNTAAASGYSFEVPPRSAKHAGGIKASSKYLFGRTGRPLNEKEKKMNKDEIFLARIPIGFATGKGAGVSKITLAQLQSIFEGKTKNWKEVGGADKPIVLAGREATEATFLVLKGEHPFFNKAKFSKVFKKDHQVVAFLESPKGENALGFGAKSNFDSLNLLEVDGFDSGVSLGLVYDLKHSGHSLVGASKEYAQSNAWKSAVAKAGFLPSH